MNSTLQTFVRGCLPILCAFFCTNSWALDYVIVVDTSGSMLWSVAGRDAKISPQNPQRIDVVRRALTGALGDLPEDSRVAMIEFNTGVRQVNEFDFGKSGAREAAKNWIATLNPPPTGDTHLWAATRKAFGLMRGYIGTEKGKSVVVRIYTDGENDDKTETKNLTLTSVLSEFSEVDGDALQPALVLMSKDLKMETKAQLRAEGGQKVVILDDPSFTVPFPPTILWSPKPIMEGQPVSFFENSKSPYKSYEWILDGRVAGKEKVLQVASLKAGAHTVKLKVTHLSGIVDSKTTSVEVVAPTVPPPDASFTVEPQVFKIGDVVELRAKANEPSLKHEWVIGGDVRQEGAKASWKGDRIGVVLVVHKVTGPSGSSQASVQIAGMKVESLPVVRFSAEPTSGVVPLDVRFKDQTTLAETVARYEWDFGDGSPASNERNPSHRFEKEGSYTVRLKITNNKGDEITGAEPAIISAQPIPPPPPPPTWWEKYWKLLLLALALLLVVFALIKKMMPESLYGTLEWQLGTHKGKKELSGRSFRLTNLGIPGWSPKRVYTLRNKDGVCLCVDGQEPAPLKRGVPKTLDSATFTFRSSI